MTNQERKKDYKKIIKIMLGMPIIIVVLTAIFMILAGILEVATGISDIHSITAMLGLASLLLSPIPCLCMSIIGTICAAKLKTIEKKQSSTLFIIGILEIVITALWFIVVLGMIFIAGPSV